MEIDIKSEVTDVLNGDSIYQRCDYWCYRNEHGVYVREITDYSSKAKPKPKVIAPCSNCSGKGQKLTSFGEQLRDLIKEVIDESKAAEKSKNYT